MRDSAWTDSFRVATVVSGGDFEGDEVGTVVHRGGDGYGDAPGWRG
jgi:hypothetical protein